MTNKTLYTLVRHSAWTSSRDPDFKKAVELRSITEAQAGNALGKGGKVFQSYKEAQDAEEAANFPPNAVGLIPQAKGRFVPMGAEEIFIPS